MKNKKIMPVFAAATTMVLSASTLVSYANPTDSTKLKENAKEAVANIVNNKKDINQNKVEYKDVKYKIASIKEGCAVNVRDSKVDGAIQKVAFYGESFKVLGIEGDWVKIKNDEKEAWISGDYVELTNTNGYVTASKLNLREKASTDSKILTVVENGTKVEVLEEQGDWLKVKNGDQEGYFYAKYVTDVAPIVPEVESAIVDEDGNIISDDVIASEGVKGEVSAPVVAPDQSAVQSVLNLAYSKQGCPYVWGAEGPNTFDCSGFTMYVMRNAAGVSIPRTSIEQSRFGTTVSKDNLRPGDLVFFSTNGTGNVSHVGIYVGDGNMIHSPSTGKTIRVTSIESAYYTSHYVTAKRVL